MNIDELKLILETVTAVTGQASDVAIWWVIAQYVLPSVLGFAGMCAGFGIFAYAAIRVAMVIASAGEWEKAGKQVAAAAGGSGGVYFRTGDQEAITKALITLKGDKC